VKFDDLDNVIMLYILDDKHTAREAYLRYSLRCQAKAEQDEAAHRSVTLRSSNDCREDAR
jgi:hypothetical protein